MSEAKLARRALVVSLLAIASLLAGEAARAEDPPEASYRVLLEVDPESGRVRGASEIALVNSSDRPLETLPLLLYANRFRVQDPAIDDTNFERYYSFRFHPGEMRLSSILSETGAQLDLEVPKTPGMPAGTYVLVKLPSPVPPGKTARIRVKFETTVPDRFGMFGRRDARLVVEGGVFPQVPSRARSGAFEPFSGPMRARQEVVASSPLGDVVLSGAASVDSRTGIARTSETARTVFLAAGDDLSVIATRAAEPLAKIPAISYRGPEGREKHAARVLALVAQAAQRFHRDWLPESEPLEPILVVEAPLRDRLVHACSALLVSDRLFEVFPLLDTFHEREVERGTFELLARRSPALSREGPDAGWVAEAIGWIAIEQWEHDRAGVKGSDVLSGLGIFDFIPFIDNAIRAPKFASSDLYFGRIFEPKENVHDELERLGSSRPRGRVLAEKLRDKFGSEKLKGLALATLAKFGGDGSTLRARSSVLAGEDLAGFFDLWLGPSPRENLRILSREAVTLEDGRDGVKVGVARDSPEKRIGEVGEPVTIELRSGGKVERAVWDGRGETGAVYLPRGGFFYSFEIDPEGRVEETDKDDNFWPSVAKILVNRFKFTIDLNGGHQSSVDGGITTHPFYSYEHSVLFDGFYAGEGRGVQVAYAYSFGHRLDEVTLGNTVSASFRGEDLATGLLRDAKQTLTETTGTLVSYGLGYALETRTDALRPTHGFHLGIAGQAADPHMGGDFNFQRANANAVFLYTPERPFTFAAEAIVGEVWGTKVPTQVLFDVGGEGAVRGVRTGDFLDRALFVARGELRVSVLEDLDQNVFYLAWLRRIEVCGFADAGDVGDNVGEVWKAPAKWKFGSGAGLRGEFDTFGVRPTVVRFDIAWRCDHGGGDKRGRPQFYLGVNQSF